MIKDVANSMSIILLLLLIITKNIVFRAGYIIVKNTIK